MNKYLTMLLMLLLPAGAALSTPTLPPAAVYTTEPGAPSPRELNLILKGWSEVWGTSLGFAYQAYNRGELTLAGKEGNTWVVWYRETSTGIIIILEEG